MARGTMEGMEARSLIMNASIITMYSDWLRNDLNLLNDHSKDGIVTPILNAMNDYQEISVSRLDDGSYRLSDDGNTMTTLRFEYGIDVTRGTVQQKTFESLCFQYNIERTEHNHLISHCIEADLPWTLHYMSFGLVAIHDMFFRRARKPRQAMRVKPMQTYVEQTFLQAGIPFEKQVRTVGRSGLSHVFDFKVGQSVMVNAPDALKPDNTQLMLFEWEDYRKGLEEDSLFYIVGDDRNQTIDRKLPKLIHSIEGAVFCPISAQQAWLPTIQRYV